MAAALAAGTPYILTAAAVEDAFALRARLEGRGERALLGGEREGNKLPGFDRGNSPREYESAGAEAMAVILCTTNGTAAVARCREAAAIYAGSFLNARAVAAEVVKKAVDLTLVCAGKEGWPAVEDAACAGLLASLAMAAQPYEADDATLLALASWNDHKKDVVRLLQTCSHGRYLASLGYEGDLEYCARVDALPLAVTRDPAGRFVAAAPRKPTL